MIWFPKQYAPVRAQICCVRKESGGKVLEGFTNYFLLIFANFLLSAGFPLVFVNLWYLAWEGPGVQP